jgi:hypothetical protein
MMIGGMASGREPERLGEGETVRMKVGESMPEKDHDDSSSSFSSIQSAPSASIGAQATESDATVRRVSLETRAKFRQRKPALTRPFDA